MVHTKDRNSSVCSNCTDPSQTKTVSVQYILIVETGACMSSSYAIATERTLKQDRTQRAIWRAGARPPSSLLCASNFAKPPVLHAKQSVSDDYFFHLFFSSEVESDNRKHSVRPCFLGLRHHAPPDESLAQGMQMLPDD